MTHVQQMMIGLLMIAVGSFKTWLHMAAIPMLALPTCTGKTVSIAATQMSWFEQAHCWGCYMLAAGILVALHVGYRELNQQRSQRRTVATILD
ncbi:MAG: hypothetical protein AAFR82_05020 [Pseudomonadota bacterium]